MIIDYASLQDAIYKWLLKDASNLVVTTSQIASYIQLCEAELNRELRTTDLQKMVPLSVGVAGYVPLPADFREMSGLQFNDNLSVPLYMDEAALKQYSLNQGPTRPGAFSIYGGNIYFSPTDNTYLFNLFYYSKIPPLNSTTQTTNLILAKHPDVYLYGSLRQALLQLQDAVRLSNANDNYNTIVARIKEDDKNAQIPSGTAMRPSRGRAIG